MLATAAAGAYAWPPWSVGQALAGARWAAVAGSGICSKAAGGLVRDALPTVHAHAMLLEGQCCQGARPSHVSSARSESWLSGLFCGHCVQGACSWSSLVFGLTATSDSETATP